MLLSIPQLDDRKWLDLVEEGRALIPTAAPGWTDHNLHDPGVTMMELFAWLAEMDIYQLNRVAPEHIRKFLAITGIAPKPPQAARALLVLKLKDGKEIVRLPEGAEFENENRATVFRSLAEINVLPGELKTILTQEKGAIKDVTAKWRAGFPVDIFGKLPEPGNQFYLGFSDAPPRDEILRLYFAGAGEHENGTFTEIVPQSHHSVRTVWEFWGEKNGSPGWIELDPARCEFEDQTRAFSVDGTIKIKIPDEMPGRTLAKISTPLFYLRCRFAAGAYDFPPSVRRIFPNSVPLEQAVPDGQSWTIKSDAQIEGDPPCKGKFAALRFTRDDEGKIDHLWLDQDGGEQPRFFVREFFAPEGGEEGKLTLDLVLVGYGNGLPAQELTLRKAPVQQDSLRIYTLENEAWRPWSPPADFETSTRTDSHFLLDPNSGKLTFGDGEYGRLIPEGESLFAAYRQSKNEHGNLRSGEIIHLANSERNVTLPGNPAAIECSLNITNPLEAGGGAAAETIDAAQGRAFHAIRKLSRACTLEDIENLALATPGVRLARASARANKHPEFSCFKAPGVITVVVIPDMPEPKPSPSRGLLQAVRRYLNKHRILGGRIEVVAPIYTTVGVQASVRALPGVSRPRVQGDIENALRQFLDARTGGPGGSGWPFGREVYRSEIMQIIDEIDGVDHILSLELVDDDKLSCGNICIGPRGLAASGNHKIEVN